MSAQHPIIEIYFTEISGDIGCLAMTCFKILSAGTAGLNLIIADETGFCGIVISSKDIISPVDAMMSKRKKPPTTLS